MSLLALAKQALSRSCERSELSEKSEIRGEPAVSTSVVDGVSSHNSLCSLHSQLRSTDEDAEWARLLAAGERAVRGVIATSDEGELIVEGEP